jgi:regulation of enolase protein 1 (concanavalin A-like superfamily)
MKLTPFLLGLLLSIPLGVVADPGAVTTAIPQMGSATDPSGNSQITGNAERLTIAMTGGDHALDIERNRMTAPRVLQEVSGDFTVQVKVSGTYPQGASTEVPGRRPFQGAGLLLWVDQRTYVRLERAQVNIERDGKAHRFLYPSWELRLEGKSLRMATGADGTLQEETTMLRLSRTGNKVVGAVSEDGATWRELDPLTVKLPEKVQVGVVAGHNTTNPFTATFENFTLQPQTAETK